MITGGSPILGHHQIFKLIQLFWSKDLPAWNVGGTPRLGRDREDIALECHLACSVQSWVNSQNGSRFRGCILL